MAILLDRTVTVTCIEPKIGNEIMSNESVSVELQQAAKELAVLFNKVNNLANAEQFNLEFDTYDGSLAFKDWNNSSCYGEEVGRDFNVESDGAIWHPSSC